MLMYTWVIYDTPDGRRRWSAVAGQPPPRQGAGGYSSEAMAADAVALMDALGWTRAHLVGMSLGGARLRFRVEVLTRHCHSCSGDGG